MWSGHATGFRHCVRMDPCDRKRPTRCGDDIKDKFRIRKTAFTLAHDNYKKKTGEGGDGDLELYFWRKCCGDTKLLYCHIVWGDHNINMLGKILPDEMQTDTGVMGEGMDIKPKERGKYANISSRERCQKVVGIDKSIITHGIVH